MKVLEKMEIHEVLLSLVKTKLKDRLEECDLSCIPYSIVKAGLEQLGYTLSESEEYEDDVMETNGWERDYYMCI